MAKNQDSGDLDIPSSARARSQQITFAQLLKALESGAKILSAVAVPGGAGFTIIQVFPDDTALSVVVICAVILAILLIALFRYVTWIRRSLTAKIASSIMAISFLIGGFIGAVHPLKPIDRDLQKYIELKYIKINTRGTTDKGMKVALYLDRDLRPVIADLEKDTILPKIKFLFVVSVDPKAPPGSGVQAIAVPEIIDGSNPPYKCMPVMTSGSSEAQAAEFMVAPLERLISNVVEARGQRLC